MTARITTVDLGLDGAGLTSGCDCGGCRCGDCGGCGACGNGNERPRWFTGQLVGPGDLEALQQWVIGKARRHNRMLHGWGVACGLAVSATRSPVDGTPVPWSVTIGAGYALTGCGDEVFVPDDVRVDIRTPRPDPDDVCGPPADPWCAPVRERRDPERTYYLAIRYAEQSTRPVRATACACGCDNDPCEYSRVAESYALGVLDVLPDCYQESAQDGSLLDDRKEAVGCSPRTRRLGTRLCPDCCSPWLVLADLRVDARGGVLVDPLTHRRFLASFGRYGFTCTPRPDNAPNVTITQPESGATFPSGDVNSVEFQASASDPEDGPLSAESVQWFDFHNDNRRQPLGHGASMSTVLSWDDEDKPTQVTRHTVLAEATDSDGNVATDSITVSVGRPEPVPPPPRITSHSPGNGVVLPEGWNSERRRIELSFDREMDGTGLDHPDPWLRAWAIYPEDISRNFTSIAKLEVVSLDSGRRRLARYDLQPDGQWPAYLYLIQVRSESSITDVSHPPQLLDSDFAGTKLSAAILDEIWPLPAGMEHRRPHGWVDRNGWGTTSNALPSGDGHQGGRFHLLFYVQPPIN